MDSMSEAMRESDNALILAAFENEAIARSRGEAGSNREYEYLTKAVLDRMNGK